jgi:hypothetical protein
MSRVSARPTDARLGEGMGPGIRVGIGGRPLIQATASSRFLRFVRAGPIGDFQQMHLIVIVVVIVLAKPPRQRIDSEGFGSSFL